MLCSYVMLFWLCCVVRNFVCSGCSVVKSNVVVMLLLCLLCGFVRGLFVCCNVVIGSIVGCKPRCNCVLLMLLCLVMVVGCYCCVIVVCVYKHTSEVK